MIDDERIHLPTADTNHIPHGLAYVRALPIVRGRKTADLCCGTGYGTRLLSEAAIEVVGYDYSKDAIGYCLTRPLDNVNYVLADVEALGAIDAEVITCMQGLEHLKNPKELIKQNLDKVWVFALPNDQTDSNIHHHHRITDELIQDWFNGRAMVDYFDDEGNYYREKPDYFTNFFGVYRG